MKKYFIFINEFCIHSFPCSTSTVINERHSDENQRAQQQSWRRLQREENCHRLRCHTVQYSTVTEATAIYYNYVYVCAHARAKRFWPFCCFLCAVSSTFWHCAYSVIQFTSPTTEKKMIYIVGCGIP